MRATRLAVAVTSLALALAAPLPAAAQLSNRWTVLTTTRTGTIAFDSATVDRLGPRVFEAWLRIDADPGDSVRGASFRSVPYSFSLARYGLDCARRRIAVRGSTYYDSAGSVLSSNENDSLRWQLALPESRGEEFLREFCTAIEGRRRPSAWIIPAGSRESFSPSRARVRTTDTLWVRNGIMSGHMFLIDTVGLAPGQLKAVRDFNQREPIRRSLLFTGNEVGLIPLPIGSYRLFCTFHSKSLLDDLFIEVVEPQRQPQVRPATPSSRTPQPSSRP